MDFNNNEFDDYSEDIYLESWRHLKELGNDITWAWNGWLPKGFLILLVGGVGMGKSTLALKLCGNFLTGANWLDGTPNTEEPGVVVWCEAESSLNLNMARAERWNLPIENIVTPFGQNLANFSLDDSWHKQSLEYWAETDYVRFIVIDSLRSACGGDENNSEFVKQEQYLAELARKYHKPILLIHHLRKKGKFDTEKNLDIDRVRGSSAITQIPRIVIGIETPDLDFPDKRQIRVMKSNLSIPPEPIGFTITDHGIENIGKLATPTKVTQKSLAKGFLKDFLKDGYKLSTEIYETGAKKGLDKQTLQRAKKDLGIVARRQDKIWVWEFPPDEEPNTTTPLFES